MNEMEEQVISLSEIFEAIKKRWIMIVAITLSATLISGILSFFVIKPVYETSTKLFIGKEESEDTVYNTNDIIEKLQEDIVFDEEKEEVISKLLSKDINLNIYDFAIDNIFNDVEAIDIMEPYGEFWS